MFNLSVSNFDEIKENIDLAKGDLFIAESCIDSLLQRDEKVSKDLLLDVTFRSVEFLKSYIADVELILSSLTQEV